MQQRIRQSLVSLGLLALSLGSMGCNTELKRARESVQKKDFAQAADLYENVLKNDPENEYAIREVTQLYCETLKNNFKCAIKVEDLYKKFPNDEKIKGWYKEAVFGRAKSLYMQQQMKAATSSLQDYLKLVKDDGTAYFMYGNIKFRLNKNPPYTSSQMDELKKAVDYFTLAVKHSKPTDKLAMFDENVESLVQWEAHVQTGVIYKSFIVEDFKKFQEEQEKKKPAAAPKKRGKGRKGKKSKAVVEEEGSKFVPNKEYFEKAVAAMEAASKVPQPNKNKAFYPFLEIGVMYAQFKGEPEKGIEWLKKAYALNEIDGSIVGNLKMVYDILAEKAEKAGEKDKKAEYEKLSQEYASKMESLQGKR
jgi:tetratricopeptide (TPR) repeat protein